MWNTLRTLFVVMTLSVTLVSAAAQQSEEERLYQAGSQALDESRWQDSIKLFDQVVEREGPRMDAALYWRAYALNRSGDPAGALESLRVLRQRFPESSWRTDAGALEVEIRQQSGQPVSPGDESDDDLKILALQGLLQSDPDRALPTLEHFVQTEGNPRLKKKALFLLAQAGNSPAGREAIERLARNDKDPETQLAAIRALGVVGGKGGRETLSQIYSSTSSVDVKKRVLQSFMIAGQTSLLLEAARNETNPELVKAAISELGNLGATARLKELYEIKKDEDIRKAILRGLFVAGDRSSLLQLAKTEPDRELRLEAIEKLGLAGGTADLKTLYGNEQDDQVKEAILRGLFLGNARTELREIAVEEESPEMRHRAIRYLGLMGSSTVDGLLEIYHASSSDKETRLAVIQALFLQSNAEAMVKLARSESDLELKKALVKKLSLLNSPAAKDYFLEVLDQ